MPKLKILQDEDPIDPRKNDNLGTMVCWHKRYKLGDVQLKSREAIQDLLASLTKDDVDLTLRLYDHSGITMSIGNNYPFNDVWDSMEVGIIYVKADKIKAEYGEDKDSKEKAKKYLQCEVEEYDNYLTGNVWGFVIYEEKICDCCGHKSEEVLDSCWGFNGNSKECVKEALDIARANKWEIENKDEF